MAGIVAVRRGDRLQVFVQAGDRDLRRQRAVVSIFSLLGERDLRGVLELWFAAGVGRGGAAVAAVGPFAVLGYGLRDPDRLPAARAREPVAAAAARLLVETPGTYHHSLMVGNLAERAAEAIGADPLVTRVAAYYHDVGKLANPLAFIENQAGGENIHDQLEPETAPRSSSSTSRTASTSPTSQAAQGAHRLHPAAPRDGDHELLLCPGQGAPPSRTAGC